MKLKEGSLTFLVGEEVTRIEIRDEASCTTFAEIELTAEQLSKVLSRQAHVRCKINVFGLKKIGKKMIHKPHEFEITGLNLPYNNRDQILSEEIKKTLPEGWVADNYFSSQNSFFSRDGKDFAKTTIRTWIDIVD